MTDIAIVGVSFQMPQGAVDEDGFWDILESRSNVMTEWPASRVDIDSFNAGNGPGCNKLQSRGAHFLKQDIAAFDAPFFSITPKEAASMDPLQRMVLETAYRAFENAGMSVESIKGSRTAVFASSITEDYARMLAMDPDMLPPTAATGTSPAIMPNRVSWYFDLLGPSVHVDTACSSSMTALDLACQAINSGNASAALVLGANLMLSPHASVLLNNLGVLSPDSVCYAFDHRANGYSRGEGVIALVLKHVADAVSSGDMIRAVIRSIASNQDGKTPGLSQPSADSQEQLIRHVYQRAGLSFQDTRFFEAHGTGTPVGDPIEVKAIGRVFRSSRSQKEPLYVASVKSNIGHLEASSGLAAIVKAMLVLEKGIIPPHALLEKINPDLDASFYNIDIPTVAREWPTKGLRRISVNSFGFGGSNTHVVMDDAFHYLESRGLNGNHCTLGVGLSETTSGPVNGTSHNHIAEQNGQDLRSSSPTTPRLLVWSAANEKSLERIVENYELYCQTKAVDSSTTLDKLAYTLACRRSHMLWRGFALVGNVSEHAQDVPTKLLPTVKPIRASGDTSLAFVFTGQGAQYVDMGLALMRYSVFEKTLQQVDDIFRRFGAAWSLFDEIHNSQHIDEPEYSQPITTALQIALVELLTTFGISPSAVVGHSSGEIAAAYTAGALSLESACKVAYYRGKLSAKLKAVESIRGAMLSANLQSERADAFLAKLSPSAAKTVTVACINSPFNVTLSGPEADIDIIKEGLDKQKIFAHKLQTGGMAYHSSSMKRVASEYLALMGTLEPPQHKSDAGFDRTIVPMVSSVTGQLITAPKLLANAQYWVDNMVSPVKFSGALATLIKGQLTLGVNSISDLIEVGPHPALRRPVHETLGDVSSLSGKRSKARYLHVLKRSSSALDTTLRLVGQLFCHGHPVLIAEANMMRNLADRRPRPFLVNCPEYPFDHSNTYWSEPRASRNYRLRPKVRGDSLGDRVLDWNPLEPRWRRLLSVETTPWTKDHHIFGSTLYPGAGMLVMALEAVQQTHHSEDRKISGFYIKEASFINPIIVGQTREDTTEVSIQLRPVQKAYEKESVWSEINIYAYYRERWTECFHALIQTQYAVDPMTGHGNLDDGLENRLRDKKLRLALREASASCGKLVNSQNVYNYSHSIGLAYGEAFQVLDEVRVDGDQTVVARIDVSKPHFETASLVHPAVIDGAFQAVMVQEETRLGELPVTVPSQLQDAWFSAGGWQYPQTSSVQIMTRRDHKSGMRSAVEASIYMCADDGSSPLCTMDKIVLTSVSTATTSSTNDDSALTGASLLYGVEWKPQFTLLTPEQLHKACKADIFTQDDTHMTHLRRVLDATINMVVRTTLSQLSAEDRLQVPAGLHKYIQWMDHYVKHTPPPPAPQDAPPTLEQALNHLESLHPPWKFFPTIARSLPSILLGQANPLQLAFQSSTESLASAIYADISTTICNSRFRTLLDLISHENPTLRILEIGAGTGGMTNHVLSVLSDLESTSGGRKFATYTYTDISPAFFENAAVRFKEYEGSGRMRFAAFDVEKDPVEQGFAGEKEVGSYDLVIAASVLHATEDLGKTLRNVRKMLKSGTGRLVALEIAGKGENVLMNFGFGVLPGWWRCSEEWRRMSPAITEEQWDRVFRGSGFSGSDLVLRDWESQECHLTSIFVSTAMEVVDGEGVSGNALGRILMLSRRGKDGDLVLPGVVEAVRSKLRQLGHNGVVEVIYIEQVRELDLGDDDILVSLVETAAPFLANLSATEFSDLQDLIRQVKSLVWVTSVTLDDPQYAYYSTSRGWLRSMRSENIDKQIISLDVEAKSEDELSAGYCAEYVAKVLEGTFVSMSAELEYVVQDGQLTTARLYQERALNDRVRAQVSPQLKSETWQPGPGVKLSVATPGFLDTIEFAEDPICHNDLGPDQVEIEAKAWGLSFRDVFVALGRLDGTDLGYDFAGIVRRVGSAYDAKIQPGDRVCGSSLSCMRTYPRTLAKMVTKIPDSMSFETAASFISPGVTAYYSLIHVARLKKGEKILIHSASGSTGQMAVWIAKMVGAEIFATVGFQEKKQLLMEEFGIPADHIFYSRNTSFSQGVMRMTDGKGVDVVLNSLSGDGLRASWECMASFGRFVEIGKADITSNSGLPMEGFLRNISFTGVDLYHVAQSNQELACDLLQDVMSLLNKGTISHPSPLHVFSVTNVEQAFRYLQSGKNTGRIIISVAESDVVPKRLLEPPTCKFDPNSSYVIVGGLGGLGRAIIKWMADRGAKHLILPSRSGPASPAAIQVIDELRARGVSIASPKCDASSAASLASLLETCKKARTPPVKGCINAAMVLQDAVFDNMTHAQWELTIKSKIQTSWNLHNLLPKSLDFFILLSSLSGIYGSISQSNYAAGCNFQDALARFRVAHGEKAVSFDIGWMRNIGIVAETAAYQANRRKAADMGQIEDTELMALLDIYCDPNLPLLSMAKSQLLVGAVTPADVLARGEAPPVLVQRPLFAAFSQALGRNGGNHDDSGAGTDFAQLFRHTTRFEERAEIVVQALAAKLARALSISADDVEPSRQLADYGVDSLMAVELRNWITKDFAANVAVFDIMGGTKISAIGDLVVEKSTVS